MISVAEFRVESPMAPDSAARAIAVEREQLVDIDVGEIVVRPTAQCWKP